MELGYYIHKIRGIVKYTEACAKLQEDNPDTTNDIAELIRLAEERYPFKRMEKP